MKCNNWPIQSQRRNILSSFLLQPCLFLRKQDPLHVSSLLYQLSSFSGAVGKKDVMHIVFFEAQDEIRARPNSSGCLLLLHKMASDRSSPPYTLIVVFLVGNIVLLYLALVCPFHKHLLLPNWLPHNVLLRVFLIQQISSEWWACIVSCRLWKFCDLFINRFPRLCSVQKVFRTIAFSHGCLLCFFLTSVFFWYSEKATL